MSIVKSIRPTGAAVGGHYSPGVQAGGFIFVSGQTPRDENRNVIGSAIGQQTEVALRNLEKVLRAADATLDDVVKTTVYLADLSDFQGFDEVYSHFFSSVLPARTTVGSALNGVLVEIDAIAFAGASPKAP